MREARAYLATVVREYTRAISACRYDDLRTRQAPPFAPVAYGGAGVAYALARIGRARVDVASVARQWAQAALLAPRADYPSAAQTSPPRASIFSARIGARFVSALIGGPPDVTRAFVASARPRRDDPPELYGGLAGVLCALLVLYERSGDPRALERAEEIATRLRRRPEAWDPSGLVSLAHGAPGILYALLRWAEVSSAPIADDIHAALTRVAEARVAKVSARVGTTHPAAERSVCNGSAGMLLLWAKAYERTGARRYLTLARASARHAESGVRGSIGSLCCGLAGRAFALLAIDAVDPSGAWRERALPLAVAAVATAASEHPNGLLRGFPGIACAADAVRSRRAPSGFPVLAA